MATQKSWNKAAGYEMFKAGKNDKEIGEALGVTAATVSYYRKKYWDKCAGSKPVKLAPAWQEEETVQSELVGMEANIPEASEPDETAQEAAEDSYEVAQDAVLTAQVVLTMANWKSVDDLKEARMVLDHLIERCR